MGQGAPPAMTDWVYAVEPDLPVAAFAGVLAASGLGDTRPLHDPARLQRMLAEAGLVLTARLAGAEGELIGVARCVTDFSWCCYVAELAVAPAAQGRGVGRGLLDEIRRRLGPQVSVLLAAMPQAVAFYERIGMPPMPNTFCFSRTE